MNTDLQYLGLPRWLLWRILRASWPFWGVPLFRPRVRGAEELPEGGFLLLGNHTASPDNFWVAAPIRRPTHIMTGSALFRNPVLGTLLRLGNCFPKQVGGADSDARDEVQRRLAAGQVVQIMPEGTRTWDGRLQPIRPSIGALVLGTAAKVVLCRTDTGHLVWPRWARYPRWVPVEISYSVHEWPADVDADTIWRDIVDALEPRPEPEVSGIGFRMAEGLETFLWACPSCFARATAGHRDTFGCGACGASWQVTVDQRLVGTTDTSVRRAWDAIVEHYRGLAVDHPDVSLHASATITGDLDWEGTLELTADALVGEGFRVGLDELKTVYMDVGNTLRLRTMDGRIDIDPVGQSTWMWCWFIDHARTLASRQT